ALCPGPLPALVGGLATLVVVVPIMGGLAGAFAQTSGPVFTVPVVSNADCATCPATAYASPPSSQPLLVAAPIPNGVSSSYAAPVSNEPVQWDAPSRASQAVENGVRPAQYPDSDDRTAPPAAVLRDEPIVVPAAAAPPEATKLLPASTENAPSVPANALPDTLSR